MVVGSGALLAVGCARFALDSLEAVALHNVGDTLQVGWAPGSHYGANLAEKLGTEHTGSDGDKEPRSIGVAIDELVHSPAWNEKCLAWRERAFATFDNERACAGQSVDGLIVGHVPVWCWHARIGRHNRLKERKGSVGVAPFEDVANFNCADSDYFFRG
jgi:hypothetical protein